MDGDAGLIAAAAVNAICLWCEGEFERRKGGSPQRFCNSKHRDAFHSAGRRYAEHAVRSGQLTVADLVALRKHARFFRPRNTVRTTWTQGRTKTRLAMLSGRLCATCCWISRSTQRG